MRTASLNRTTSWQTAYGTLTAEYSRFVSRTEPNLICQTLDVTAPDGTIPVRIRSAVTAGVTTNGFLHFDEIDLNYDDDCISVDGRVGDSSVWIGSIIRSGTQNNVTGERGERSDNLVRHEIEAVLRPGGTFTVEKLSVVTGAPSRDKRVTESTGRAILERVERQTMDRLRESHQAAWETLWDQNDIEFTGSVDVQRAVRFSLFSLLRSHRPGETRFGICPKGHAGEAYFGRYFWDTEIHLLPFFIYSNPTHARDLLRFRTGSLAGSVANARRYGYQGAKIAWEADNNGVEHCPNWQYADHELHVTADVTFAIAHYVSATGDDRFLFDEALPLIFEGARFWIDRIDWADGDTPVLLGIMGPDEYKPLTKNNAYTNRLVRFHLEYAAVVATRCRTEAPEMWKKHQDDLDIRSEELELFRTVAGKIPTPFDQERGIIAQSEDFHDFVDVDVNELRALAGGRLGTGRIAAMVSQERLYRLRALKQADVVAMLLLFPTEFDRKIALRSYRYYESITTHDSSLSASTHATVAAQLGEEEAAFEFFNHSLAVDVDPAYGNCEQGIHVANCGGNWQTVVFGFLGLSPAYTTNEPIFAPRLPAEINEISTRLWWRGRRLAVTAARLSVTVELLSGPAITVTVYGERRTVYSRERWTVDAESKEKCGQPQ
jgi:kojibiose phosphorylase